LLSLSVSPVTSYSYRKIGRVYRQHTDYEQGLETIASGKSHTIFNMHTEKHLWSAGKTARADVWLGTIP